MAGKVDPETVRILTDVAKQKGIEIKVGVKIDEISGAEHVDGVVADGEKIAATIQLIDLKVGPTEDDYMMIEWLNTNKVPYVVIATKCDKVNATTRKANYEALVSHPLFNPPYTDAPVPVVMFSSQTGTGRNDVLAILSELLK